MRQKKSCRGRQRGQSHIVHSNILFRALQLVCRLETMQ